MTESHTQTARRRRWQLSLRELILITAVVALALGYWKANAKRRFIQSPFMKSLQPPLILRAIPVASKPPMLNGGGGGSSTGRFARHLYHYTISSYDPDLPVGPYITAVKQAVLKLLKKNDCDINGSSAHKRNKQLVGFVYDYSWKSTRGSVLVSSQRWQDELHIEVFHYEFPDAGF